MERETDETEPRSGVHTGNGSGAPCGIDRPESVEHVGMGRHHRCNILTGEGSPASDRLGLPPAETRCPVPLPVVGGHLIDRENRAVGADPVLQGLDVRCDRERGQ